ncbi:unnamed protein product [Brassica rapa subsp. trilocularis]
MAWKRSTVVFYYSSSDRFTTTDRSLGREHRIKRFGLHNWISIGPPRCRQSHCCTILSFLHIGSLHFRHL